MTEKGLIYREGDTGVYRLTETGTKLLNTFEGISDMISVSVKETSRAR